MSKKKITLLVLLNLILLAGICTVFTVTCMNLSKKNETLYAKITSLNSMHVADEAKINKLEKTVTADKATINKLQKIVNTKKAVIDYGTTDFGDWAFVCPASVRTAIGSDELYAALNQIDNTEYGTAGSSLKQCSSAVSVLTLAKITAGNTDAVKKYLTAMTPLQLDYFSFQWLEMGKYAGEILADPAANKGLLEDSGNGDFKFTAGLKQSYNYLYANVNKLLDDMGVQYVWKEHTDLEPFNNSL